MTWGGVAKTCDALIRDRWPPNKSFFGGIAMFFFGLTLLRTGSA